MTIPQGRSIKDPFNLATLGFALAEHSSAVADAHPRESIDFHTLAYFS